MTVFAGEASDDQTVQEPTAAEVTESSEEAPAEGTVAEDQKMDVQTTENAEETTEEAVEKESNEGVLLKAASAGSPTSLIVRGLLKKAGSNRTANGIMQLRPENTGCFSPKSVRSMVIITASVRITLLRPDCLPWAV